MCFTFLYRAMASLIKLQSLEEINAELTKTLHDTKLVNEELLATKEKLARELEKAKAECSKLEGSFSSVSLERDNVDSELKGVLIMLAQSREAEVRGTEMSSLNEQDVCVVGVVSLSICLHVCTIMMQY